MKKTSSIIWGGILVVLGLVIGLNALGIIEINLFFNGWWTLFIIIPCAVGLFNDGDKIGNIIGIAIGVLLLLASQNVISFNTIFKLVIPAIIIIFGIKLIAGGLFNKQSEEVLKKLKENGIKLKSGNAIFSGNDMRFDGEVFDGAELNAVFGGVKCDLRNAIIDKDCVINASAVFGGIDILVGENVNIKLNSTSIFGGVSNKKRAFIAGAPTIYINATCLFGGIDIK
ncbi:MAG TPA: LiaF-related protein [Candidatus Avimonas sp.]|nr:cell wall-active antibiotics response protein [Clostridiales bacterium]HPU58576.1 LiaF-related protein [Candidatus Avimonas sp.]